MIGRILFLGLATILAVTSLLPGVANAAWQAAARAATGRGKQLDMPGQQAILNSTVMINFLIPDPSTGEQSYARSEDGDRVIHDTRLIYFDGTSGLGNVIEAGDERLILTHDHWSDIYDYKLIVELTDADGRLLETMNGTMWRTLVRYRDGGTMLLSLPPGLSEMGSALPAAQVRSEASLPPGATVHVPGRSGQQLAVEPFIVEAVAEGRDVLRLRSPSGFVVRPGNSGAGVWYEGELVANITSAVLTGEGRTTAMGEASLTPATAISSLASQSEN